MNKRQDTHGPLTMTALHVMPRPTRTEFQALRSFLLVFYTFRVPFQDRDDTTARGCCAGICLSPIGLMLTLIINILAGESVCPVTAVANLHRAQRYTLTRWCWSATLVLAVRCTRATLVEPWVPAMERLLTGGHFSLLYSRSSSEPQPQPRGMPRSL